MRKYGEVEEDCYDRNVAPYKAEFGSTEEGGRNDGGEVPLGTSIRGAPGGKAVTSLFGACTHERNALEHTSARDKSPNCLRRRESTAGF